MLLRCLEINSLFGSVFAHFEALVKQVNALRLQGTEETRAATNRVNGAHEKLLHIFRLHLNKYRMRSYRLLHVLYWWAFRLKFSRGESFCQRAYFVCSTFVVEHLSPRVLRITKNASLKNPNLSWRYVHKLLQVRSQAIATYIIMQLYERTMTIRAPSTTNTANQISMNYTYSRMIYDKKAHA